MSAFLISVIVSALGGIIAFLCRGFISRLFVGQTSAQQAIDEEKKMAEDAANPVTKNQLINKLEDGSV